MNSNILIAYPYFDRLDNDQNFIDQRHQYLLFIALY